MSPAYIEAVVKSKPSADRQVIEEWFMRHGFAVTVMDVGLLVTAPPSQLEKVFGVDLSQARLPLTLAVPGALQQHVDFIEIPSPRRYH